MFLVFAIAVANTTSGAIAQPAIADAFGAGAADVGAIVFGYSTAFAIMTAVYGSLARRFGLARCLTFGVVLIAVGAGIAVVSVNLPMLIAARVLQGFGAGAIPTLTMALISRRLQGPARARALGINVAAVGVGFAAGPLLGGLLLEAFGWRGAMALGLFVAPAALVIPRLDREAGRREATIDVPGIVLLAIAVGGLVLVINRLPVMGLGGPLLAIAALSTAAGVVLVRRSRGRPGAALPLQELGDGVLRRMMLLGYVGQTAFFGVLILAPIIAARIHDLSGFALGLLLAPMAILIAIVSPRNGRVSARIGRRATTTLSLSVIGIACGFLAWQGPAAALPILAAGLVAAGVGFGLLSAPLVNEVSRRFGDDRRSLALGMYNLAFFLGSASGGAIATGFVQAGVDIGPFAGRPLVGASTGLLLLAVMPIAILAFDRLRPAPTVEAVVPAAAD
jgi:DHA2 family metal-tetracycline-proton antiporter-like MFS transporter/DHA2 family florfenicol/chloramphenicol resistance protein-like MFS transporter